MIPVGTLCMIVRPEYFPHLAGKTCTVIGPLMPRVWSGIRHMAYEVDIRHPEFDCNLTPGPHQLIPLTPPARKKSTKRDEPVTA